ncbi:MAG TPA: hypothetical protein VGI54_05035, partial [Solirubrobacteraceae bacterium]
MLVRGRARGRVRVVLQRRLRGAWRAGGQARAVRRRFVLVWLAPSSPGVVQLRVAVVRRSGRVVGVTRVVRVAVSATRVLRAARVVSAPAPGARGLLRYSGAGGVRAGQFVAVGVGRETPFGLLERVVSARRSRGSTVLRVEPATLLDAVPEGSIDLAPGAGAAAAAPARRFRSLFDCRGAAHASLVGSLAVRLAP